MKYSVRTVSNSMYEGNRAAIYCRLSKDDEREGESTSIEHQRELLTDYCLKNDFKILGIYQDYGFTGTNQKRPGFQNLLAACGEKKVDIVVTKDLSRLGRDYLGTGELIERTFPKLRIRFIALNDAVDSINGTDETIGFRNMMNDYYSRDVSKKVHSGYLVQARQGRFTGNVPPLGYKKSTEDRNKLIIDEETAPIVKHIFQMAYDGHGVNYIRRRLEEEKVPCPCWWNRTRGIRNHYAKKALENEDAAIEEIKNAVACNEADERKADIEKQEKYEKRLREIEKMMASLYEDRISGRIAESNFYSILESVQKEQADLEEKLSLLQTETIEKEQSEENTKKWLNLIREYSDIKELSRDTGLRFATMVIERMSQYKILAPAFHLLGL